MNTRLTSVTVASLLAVGVALTPAAASAGVRICTLPGSPTTALDRSVAREVFRSAGIAATFNKRGVDDDGGDDGISAGELKKSLEHDCDVIAGFPRSEIADASGSKMTFSQGYLRSGYVSVSLLDAQASSDVKETIAATYGSPSQLIAAQQANARFDLENTSEQTIGAVAAGRAQRAIVWYPSVVAYERAHPRQRFRVAATSSPYSNWQLSFAFGPGKDALQKRIDATLSRMSGDGRLASLTRGWALPDTVAQAASARAPGRFLDGAIASAPSMPARSGFIKVSASEGSDMPSFDQAQVQHGKKLYGDACAKCHGDQLEGNTAPALSGESFAPEGKSHITVGGIFQYMSNNMPADRPGKMTAQEYEDVMAFLLYSNGYDASKSKLTADAATASKAPLIAGPRK
ncbi:MAG: c-type cytochrome [Burkholderia contaminans]|uniref:C-type cytochrome n=1 Tax=Burkholderia contaminans TaxID=488447 RepID=A0AAP4R7D4_9BURK|nr:MULTISPECIES: c-type cytochrome [Burkholderia]MBD1411418.1 transporter substrate-binding domain-containing protein [Burkholderia contaminans]MBH9672302.1 transporter substrate-binding domain-containing protein [Burkholderia contaminans]MBH9679664.1 transporter substrate-binding domain-containing protein [Burkholderia contaminans]MBH9709711.1 transporter substrate-binding domain-containing protein [Burkholderia contaminans]MBH9724476.1 transporter substrate-binding domain-containing protein 